MNEKMRALTDRLELAGGLSLQEYKELIDGRDEASAEELARRAVNVRKRVYGEDIYVRGLIEISNICRNDCYYCGIRRGNAKVSRYRLGEDDVVLVGKDHAEDISVDLHVLDNEQAPFVESRLFRAHDAQYSPGPKVCTRHSHARHGKAGIWYLYKGRCKLWRLIAKGIVHCSFNNCFCNIILLGRA